MAANANILYLICEKKWFILLGHTLDLIEDLLEWPKNRNQFLRLTLRSGWCFEAICRLLIYEELFWNWIDLFLGIHPKVCRTFGVSLWCNMKQIVWQTRFHIIRVPLALINRDVIFVLGELNDKIIWFEMNNEFIRLQFK